MKIVRWLIGHTFLIVLIVAVIYGYMFWGNLAGEDTPAGKVLAYLSNEFEEVGEFVAAIEAKQEKLSQQESPGIESSEAESSEAESSDAHETTADNEMSAVAESVEPGIRTQPAETRAVEQTVEKTTFSAPADESRRSDYAAVIDSRDDSSDDIRDSRGEDRNDYRSVEQQQVTSSYNYNDTAAQQNAAGIIEAAVEPVDEVVTTNLQSKSAVSQTQVATDSVPKDTFVSAEVSTQLSNVDEHGGLKQDELKQDSQQGGAIRANWITARKSFFQRKYDLSEQNYQKVIDSTEDNVDAYGELGNVYFNQGKKEQAASAYFEAAAILVRKGQVNRAQSLMGLLRHLDKNKASELQKLIDSAAS